MVRDQSGFQHKVKTLIAAQKTPPEHRLYAILALTETGEKVYLKPQQFDFDLYEQARQRRLVEFLPLPDMPIRKGHNTNQARGYNYTHWQHFFNERQLLCLGLLLKGILKIDEQVIRDQFLCLFSSTLEFNNLFCSFKGEGTGAVRHLFSPHIFKPEKMPLENNVWGTPKSSGSFSTLFKTRLMPAKIYLDKPF
jgi:putative DNA methylase